MVYQLCPSGIVRIFGKGDLLPLYYLVVEVFDQL